MTAAKDCASIAALVNGTPVGEGTITVSGVASLEEATSEDVSFLGHPKYRARVLPSRAGIVLVPPDFEVPPPAGRAWVICENPSSEFSKLVALFAPPPVQYPPGVHPSAVVHPEAELDEGVHIGPTAVVAAGARIGARSVIGAGCYVGEHTRVGEDCLLYPNVTIRERCLVGSRVIIHPGTVVGSDGFGYESGPEGHKKIPQVGIVQIDDDVEIGAQVAVDRARFGRTWIKRGAKIDNLVQIAHNVVIGEGALIVGQVGISGSARIGRGAILAGKAGVVDHVKVGNGAIVMGGAGVTKDVPDGTVVFGAPAVDRKKYARQQAKLKSIDRLLARLDELEKEVAALRTARETGADA